MKPYGNGLNVGVLASLAWIHAAAGMACAQVASVPAARYAVVTPSSIPRLVDIQPPPTSTGRSQTRIPPDLASQSPSSNLRSSNLQNLNPPPSLSNQALPVISPGTKPIQNNSSADRPQALPPAFVPPLSGETTSYDASFSDDSQPPAETAKQLRRPYWSDQIRQPMSIRPDQSKPYQLDELVWLAIHNSPFVKSVLTDPQIKAARAMEAHGVFDPTSFLQSIFHDTSDPVGNTLTTGGPSRFNEHLLDGKVGIKGRNQRGGQFEAAQQMSSKDNNSLFLVPRQQADTRLILNYTQPLWRGSGKAYNQASYIVASIERDVSVNETSRELQNHVFSITKLYWELFAARALLLQSQQGILRLEDLKRHLTVRNDLDALRSQLLHADSVIARQHALKANAEAKIVDSEAHLRALVNAPEMSDGSVRELIPATPTIDAPLELSVPSEIELALNSHPSILIVRDQLRSARTKLGVAENELMPTLNLVMDAYVRGLNGDYKVGDSLVDQFSRGAPSYSGGVVYQRPYRNASASAILKERRLEMRQLLLQLDHAMLSVSADIETAVAQVIATFTELESAVRSTLANQSEIAYLTGRLQNAIVDNSLPSLRLDELLNAQAQLIQSENAWATAQSDHMIALAALKLATGTLLSAVPVNIE